LTLELALKGEERFGISEYDMLAWESPDIRGEIELFLLERPPD